MFFMRYILMAMLMAGTAVAVSAMSQKAIAQDAQIEDAKSAGVIGERIDGYLGIVNDGAVDASLQRRVNEINARRRAAYDQLAEDTGTTTAQVARITGEKQIERTQPGHWYLNEQGVWVQR